MKRASPLLALVCSTPCTLPPDYVRWLVSRLLFLASVTPLFFDIRLFIFHHLNLPSVITYSNGNSIEFVYDAAGMKLRKIVKVGATVQYEQSYLGGLEYRKNGTGSTRVEAVYHAEGRYLNLNAEVNNTLLWQKEYTLKDHLGNARISFTDKNANGIVDIPSDIVQENHYYPFGLNYEGGWRMNDAARDNKYQYNSKEWNDDFGLNWNDYGARWYMPDIGRWGQVDPLADHPNQVNKSPYAYAWNNPINLNDPDGNCPNCKTLKDLFVFKVNEGKSIAKNLYQSAQVILNPIETYKAAKGLVQAISNPKRTLNAIKENVKQNVNDFLGDDPAAAGRASGNAKSLVIDIIVGGKGVGGAGKMGKNLSKLDNFSDIALDGADAAKIMGRGPSQAASEFKLVHGVEEITGDAKYGDIKNLSNQELINSVTNPINNDFVTVNTKTGRVVDGNTRIYELQRREININVPYKRYTPDDSAFWDLNK